MRRFIVCCSVLALGVTAAAQQSSIAGPQFEVASIKPAAPPAPIDFNNLASLRTSPDQWKASNLTLQQILENNHPEYAFPGLIAGGDAWVREARFDINARKDAKASPEEVKAMVDQLLADRFGLKTHVEQRMLSVYLLKPARADGKLGQTLAPALPQCAEARDQQRPMASWPDECRTSRFGPMAGKGSFINLQASPIADLLRSLSRMRLDRPVIDRTGLTGRFDGVLHWNQPPNAAPTPDGESLSLFTAIQEQLGLKLEASREPVDVLVIDSARRPSEN